MYNQRALLSGRIPELLETFKTEFETLAHDLNMYKMQSAEYEKKFQTQLSEINTIQSTLFELERTHNKIKQQYEEEIIRLRRQMELHGSHTDPSSLLSRPLTSPSATLETEKSHQLGSGQNAANSVSLFYPSGSGMTSPDKRRFSSSNSPLSSPTTASQAGLSAPVAKRPRTDELPQNSSIYSQHSHLQSQSAHLQSHSHPHQSPFPPLAPLSTLSNGSSPNGGVMGMLGGSPARSNNSSSPIIVDGDRSIKQIKPSPGQGPSLHSLPSIMERSVKDHTSPLVSSQSPPSTSSVLSSTLSPSSSTPPISNTSSNPPNLANPGSLNSSPQQQQQSNQISVFETKKINNSNDHTEEPNLKSESQSKKNEWIVGYNPSVQSVLNVDLAHTFDHSSVVCCVRFSNDGKFLASGCNRSTQIYDVETGEKISTFSDDNAKDGDLYIRSVCFSPDGTYLAAGAEDKTVKLWDIEKKRVAHTFVGHELDIYSLDWSHDGRFIVSGSGDKKTKIWDREKMKCVLTLGNDEVGPKDGVTSVAMSPDGRLVAAGSLDRVVRLWDTQTGYFLERFEGHTDSVYSVAFSPDGKSLASGSLDKTLKLWDLSGSRSRSRCRSTFSGHKDFVLSVAFSSDGNWLVSGSKDRTVQFWDPRSVITYMMLQGHKNSVISVAMSPTGGMFSTGSGDFLARLWRYDSRNSLSN